MISVMIPCLNEEDHIYPTIQNIVESAREVGVNELEIIAVNDGSTDGTAQMLAKAQSRYPFVRVIEHKTNMGIGFSFLEAVDQARYDKITIFAGDNNATPFLIKNLFRNMHKADLIIAYTMNTECRGRWRNLLSMLFSIFYVITFDIHLKYINGSPIYPVKKLKALKLKSKSYSLFAEINVKLLRSGITFYEVEGYVNPQVLKSSAVKLKNLVIVTMSFVRLVYEIHFKHRTEFSHKAVRAGVPS